MLLRIVFALLCLEIVVASLARQASAGDELYLFDIPAQNLREALFAYTDATGMSVLVDDGVTAKARSAQVKGRLTAEDALKTLLSGTGLDFQYTAASAFTLVPAAAAALARPSPRDDIHDEAYFRAIQTAVKSALCRRVQTLPGQYRVVIRLWIDESGVVVRSALLGSTGNRDRDQMLPAMLDGLPVGEAPPAGLPQPVTLIVLPRPPNLAQDCGPPDDRTSAKARG